MNDKIDIVIPWVDGSDPKWLAEKKQYQPDLNIDASICRYRDWGLLKYWFRGIDKYAQWVNKIFFVTWGHIPEWLDTNNNKIEIIKHSDYLPEDYRPTFNSNTIMINLHRIKGLSENFVIFNDDFYIINKTNDKDFFINNIPCDNIALNVHCPKKSQSAQNLCFNDAGVINEHFDFKTTFKKNRNLWYNWKNGKEIIRTITLSKCPRYPGFYYHHLPQGYRKSTFEKVWKAEYDYLDKVSKNKFRTTEDVNEWLMKDWQIVEGNVKIRNQKLGDVFHMRDNLMPEQGNKIAEYIEKQKEKCIVINDGQLIGSKSQEALPKIVDAFEKIFPEKSSFEK
jgi:hypothetical protein